MSPTRRQFLTLGLESIAGYALCSLALARPLLARAVEDPLRRWARALDTECRDLRRATLTQAAWRARLAALYAELPLADLLAAIDFEAVAARTALPDGDATTAPATLPPIEGLPAPRAFGQKLFGMKKGRAIAPHGHENMVSAHLVVRGRVRVRQYDRVADEPEHLVIRPSVDASQAPGQLTSISDRADNVHWLVAEAEPSFTFDVVVDNLDPSRAWPYRQTFLDVDRAERVTGGTLRAPRLSVAAAIAKYGHHG